MGRENADTDQCQKRYYEIHDATCSLLGVTITIEMFPEFFVRSGKLFRREPGLPGTWRARKDSNLRPSESKSDALSS
jgi:hypothetical protein